jgi:mRNA interferase RelE/StbE
MKYTLLISSAAARSLKSLPSAIQTRIDRVIQGLAANPRPRGCTTLAGTKNGWRVRVGDFRILYAIEDDRLIVLVVDVGNRRDVYRRM